MTKKMAGAKITRIAAARYGIAEWFGRDMTTLTPEERQIFGQIAVAQGDNSSLVGAPPCPFLQTLIPFARCNKAGGVCSMRKYASDASPIAGERIATTCPNRFLEATKPGGSIFSWISEKMLDVTNAIVVRETPFLRKIADVQRTGDIKADMEAEAEDEQKKAGRIDWLLINPASMASTELEWCAVETQALYFSGKRMKSEFDAYAKQPSSILFPLEIRRPDYRSSGPKRLWPQLDVKVPVLRNWGKKVVIVVDRYFYNNMNRLVDPSPRARNDKERRENADVAWFIVDYDNHCRLVANEVVFTSLESSRTALNATEPLSKADFTENLKRVMSNSGKANKVFKV